MKIPEYMKDKHYVTPGINTLSASGLLMLWAIIMGHISNWWLILTILMLFGGYGNEIRERK